MVNKNLQQVLKFGTVGVMNTAIDLGVLNLLLYGGAAPLVANSIAFSLAVTNSFIWNKHWTFRSYHGVWWQQMLLFFLVAIVGLGLSNLCIYYGHIRWGYDINLVKISSFVVVFWWNFFIPKFFIFHK